MMEKENEERLTQLKRQIKENEDEVWQIDRTLNVLEEHNQMALHHMQSAALSCQPGDPMYERIMTSFRKTQQTYEDGRDALIKRKNILRIRIEEAEYEMKK